MPVRPTSPPRQIAGPACACRASSKGRPKLRDVMSPKANIRNRLFKFPQMDFEMAIWEMTSLLIAPKKVFKSIYYHVSSILLPRRLWLHANCVGITAGRNVSSPILDPQFSVVSQLFWVDACSQKPKTPGTAPTHPSPIFSPSSSF